MEGFTVQGEIEEKKSRALHYFFNVVIRESIFPLNKS